MADLPHVGGVASRLDPERVRRTVAEVVGILNAREEFFRAQRHRLDRHLPPAPRARASSPTSRGATSSWSSTAGATFKTDYEQLDPVVTDIAGRGLGFGVHLVITASRYMEVRPALQGPAAEPAGAAARRPDGLGVRPQGRRERARRASRAAA